MSEHEPPPVYAAVPLTRELAVHYSSELTSLANQIPQVNYAAEDILDGHKGDRLLHNKWQHSLVVIDSEQPVAFIMGYEREAEDNEQYPTNTLYLSELAVAEDYQNKGMARSLLHQFFVTNAGIGFLTLSGELNFSVQTNSAEWNAHVIDLYKSFGFIQRSTKQYPNRVDVILGTTASELQLR